jgi:hypothetical protein
VAIAGDAFDQFQQLIREHLDPMVENLEVDADIEDADFLFRFLMASRNVTKLGKTDDSTPGYQANWRVRLQRGGMVYGAEFGQTALEMMGPDNSLVMGVGANSLHGDPTKAPQRSYIPIKSRLRKMRGLYTLNSEQLESQLLSDPIEDVAAGVIDDIVTLVRSTASSLLWGAGNGVMGYADLATTTNITEAAVAWMSIKYSQVYRFVRGQRYVVATSTLSAPRGGTAQAPAVVRCVGVDRQALKVGFQSEAGSGTIAVQAGDAFVYAGMYDFVNARSLACNGVESLLIKTGTFPDTPYNVANYPELQAFIDGDETAMEAPLPEKVDEILDLMTAADKGVMPTLAAENSLWTLWGHLERRTQSIVTVPQGQPFVAVNGARAPIVYNGTRPFVQFASPKCRPNTIFGLDASSFLRFMPNDLNVRFRTQAGGAAGAPNIFRTVQVGTQLSDLLSAEFETWYQLAQTRPNRNIIRKGFHNRRTYNAAA